MVALFALRLTAASGLRRSDSGDHGLRSSMDGDVDDVQGDVGSAVGDVGSEEAATSVGVAVRRCTLLTLLTAVVTAFAPTDQLRWRGMAARCDGPVAAAAVAAAVAVDAVACWSGRGFAYASKHASSPPSSPPSSSSAW